MKKDGIKCKKLKKSTTMSDKANINIETNGTVEIKSDVKSVSDTNKTDIEEKLKTKNFYLAVSTAQNTNEYIADRKSLLESFIPDIDSYNLFFDSLMKVVKPNTLYQLFGLWSKDKSYKVIKLPRLLCKFSTFMKKRMCKDEHVLNTEWDEIEKLLADKGCEIAYINTKADFESLYFRLKDDK